MTVHKLKEQAGTIITTRCGLQIDARHPGDEQAAAWESQVTCPDCRLPHR